jgi:ribose/xylose/arabinose/galactoside ABC-type transport system permease subunit
MPALLVKGSDRKFRVLVYDLLTISTRMAAVREHFAELTGLSGPQYSVLMAIAQYQSHGHATVGALARLLHVSSAFIATETGKLVRAGLITKRPNPNDGRSVIMNLGMRDITNAALGNFGFRDPKHFYYLAFAFVVLALFVSWRLANSRIGRAWTALREDEQVADAMGVSTTAYKLLAFAMGGAIGSVGGALFAVKIGSLTPASFQVLVSIQVLGIVILGGIGSLPGVITGSLVLVGLPGLLREFEEYRLLAYGAAVVAVMLLRPQGLIPNVRRSRELHEEDREQDKWAGDIAADEHVAPGPSPLGEGAG